MSWTVTIGGRAFTNANVDGHAYADEASGFPAMLAAFAREAERLGGAVATSGTALTPARGAATATLDRAAPFRVGAVARLQSVSDPTHYMLGAVTGIAGDALTLDVAIASGASPKSDWIVVHPAPAGLVDANGDISLPTGDIAARSGAVLASGPGPGWTGGAARAFMDMDGGAARFGAASGAGSAAATAGFYADGARYIALEGGRLVFDRPIPFSRSAVQARSAVEQWLDDTENLGAGGTADAGWAASDVAMTSNHAAAPNGTTTADLATATGSTAVEHGVEARRGSLDGSHSDIYTFSVFARAAAGSAGLRLELAAKTHGHGAWAEFDLSAGTADGSGALASGLHVASGALDAGGGWRRCFVTADMSAVPTAVPFAARILLLNGSGAKSFATGSPAEAALLWGAQANGGGLAPYVPNRASTGQAYGFSVGAADHDAQSHTLEADTEVNFRPQAAGEQRVVKIDLVQDSTAGWNALPAFDHAAAGLTEMNAKPKFASQKAGAVTRLVAEIGPSSARIWYEEV